jgi:hypothetical protein
MEMTTTVKLLGAALLLTSALSVLADVHYVDVKSINATPPFTNWTTAATNIQDAVDAAVAGDEIVVTNGIYATGGRGGNRVEVDKPLNIRSVNGPQFTTIDGGYEFRCVYLTNGAALSGFTLTNGRAPRGAGAYCASRTAVVSNCVVSFNHAVNHYEDPVAAGGGTYGGTLSNCTLSSNSASSYSTDFPVQATAYGGGAYDCALNSCTLSGNSAASHNTEYYYDTCTADGGGAYNCLLNNCTLVGNSASAYNERPDYGTCTADGGGAYNCLLNNCALVGNSASAHDDDGVIGTSSAYGGGAEGCTLKNCTLSGNSASAYGGFYFITCTADGGGAYNCLLNNCTLAGNSANASNSIVVNNRYPKAYGAGAEICHLDNCILYLNTVNTSLAQYEQNYYSSTLNNCWTTDPLFVDTNGWANLRLQSNSPCINAGNNGYASGSTDLDGNPRIVGGTVDIGAYEYQSLSLINPSVVSNRFGFNVTGQSNWVIVLEACSDFTNWTPLTTNTLSGSPFPFRDPTSPNLPQRFYRARQP